MDRRDVLGWLLLGAGIFSICGAGFDWEWFMNHRKAQFWIKIFGRQGTRIFYGVLGIGVAVGGALMVAGVLGPRK